MKLSSHSVSSAAIVLRLIQLLTQIKYAEKKDNVLTFQKKSREVVLGQMAAGRWAWHIDKEEKSLVRKVLGRCFLNREGVGAGEEGSRFL